MYFITAIISEEHLKQVPFYAKLRSHCFGYFKTWDEAHATVTDNVGSLHESIYDFIVIEDIPDGIHSLMTEEHWYYWCDALNCWQPCVKPDEFKGVINWAIG